VTRGVHADFHAPLRRYHNLWPVREHQNIKNLDDLVGSLTIAPISTAHGIAKYASCSNDL